MKIKEPAAPVKAVKLSPEQLNELQLLVSHLVERLPKEESETDKKYVIRIQKTYLGIVKMTYPESEEEERIKKVETNIKSILKGMK